jgi:hypothetical protein
MVVVANHPGAYIDVWRGNEGTATHNRAVTIELGVPLDETTGKPKRLLEDHGVCLSSALDYWEDDLFLQAFSRNLILAPELYGSPWFLRDDEFPKLARVYNLTRHYRDILPDGMMLKDQAYGPNAVSRGNGKTRIITLRNPGWNGAYASLRVNGHPVGSPQRAKAYPANPWETGNGHPDANFSYFFPVTEAMIGKTIDAVVMQFESEGNPKIPLGEFTAEVWLTAYPIPYVVKELVLEE